MATTTYTAQGAYDAIKQLESQNTILFPQTTQTVHVGTFDAATGKFTYDVPNGYEQYGVPVGGGGSTDGPVGRGGGSRQPMQPKVAIADPPSPFHRIELGYVIVYAMDLKLSFSVVNAGESTFTVTVMDGPTATIPTHPVTVTPGPIRVSPTPVPTPVPVPTPAPAPPTPHPTPTPIPPPRPTPHPVNPIKFRPNAAVDMAVIGGGPFDDNILTIDLGAFATPSVPAFAVPGTRVTLTSGTRTASIQLRILRPPVGTAGVFTMPALPTAIIYAPPLGPDGKNSASYTSTTTVISKISTTVTDSNSTKTAKAFSNQDFFDKLVGVVSDITGFATSIASLGATSTPGILAQIGSFLLGSKSSGGSALNDVKAIGSGLKLFQDIFDGFNSSNTSSDTTLTSTTQENDLQTTDTTTLTIGTPATFGPGQGDQFGMLFNVRVAWVITNNELGFTILDYDGIRQYPAQSLLDDLQSLASGTPVSKSKTLLDAATIKNLLSLDPLVQNSTAPTLNPSRFVQADTKSIGGGGTAATGTPLTVTHTVTSTETTTQNQVNTTITDYKPGWLGALFGTSPNTTTESQMSMSYSSANQQSQTYTVTSTVIIFAGIDESTMLQAYFDTLFKTFLYLLYIPPS